MKIIFHGATQDYPTSGFAKNAITQGFNIFTQHIMVTYENDQDYRNSGFAENNITLDHNICTQNIGITYENKFPMRTDQDYPTSGFAENTILHRASIFPNRTH